MARDNTPLPIITKDGVDITSGMKLYHLVRGDEKFTIEEVIVTWYSDQDRMFKYREELDNVEFSVYLTDKKDYYNSNDIEEPYFYSTREVAVLGLKKYIQEQIDILKDEINEINVKKRVWVKLMKGVDKL